MPRTRKIDKNGNTYEIVKFIVRCDLCNDTIESTSMNQTTCICNNLTIRGGLEDIRFISCLHDLITDISEWKLIK
jgi:hypothetical protein